MIRLVLFTLMHAVQVSTVDVTPMAANTAASEQVHELIDQLGGPDYHAREDASRKLLQAGSRALVSLKTAAHDTDPERAWRARRILAVIANAAEYRELQGTWTYTSVINFGKEEPKAAGALLELKDRSMTIRRRDGSVTPGASMFTIDGEATPKHFNIIAGRTITKGIYRLAGDTLTLCYPTDTSGPRPTDFETKVGDRRRLHVLTRKPAADSKGVERTPE